MPPVTSDAERLVADYLGAVWNERKFSKIPEVLSESFVMYDPVAIDEKIPGPRGQVHGPAGLETFVREVTTGFPDFHVRIREVLARGETVMYGGTLSMTHTGVFYWIPPTRKAVTVRYMGELRIADGQVVEHRVYPPLAEILSQLGFTSVACLPYLPKLGWAWLKHVLWS